MPLIFVLTSGAMLWTDDTVAPATQGRMFNASRTAVLVPQREVTAAGGLRDALGIVKLSDDIGKPDTVTVFDVAITSVRESKDDDLNIKCRATLSGLHLAK